jgi:hypothetical protein
MFIGVVCGFIFGEMSSYSYNKTYQINELDKFKELLKAKEDHIAFLQAELTYERRSKIDITLKEDNNENCITKN